MPIVDPSTAFGARVRGRLANDLIGWLTTTGANGTPEPSPIWFLWDGTEFLIYSQPGKPKLRNIERNPRVALHLDGDGRGCNIVVFTGTARIVPAEPPANANAAYVAKYHANILRIGMTDETFARSYSVPIRVTPEKLRGH